MRRDELRSLQAPLKQRYRDSPESARVPARAVGRVSGANLDCDVESGGRVVTAGLHQAAGGSGAMACSADLLLESLVACAGVTLRAVSTAMGVTVHSGTITAAAWWDARGTLAIDRSVPVGIQDITITFDLDTDGDEKQLQQLLTATERYCVIFQTLQHPPKVVMLRA